MKHAEESPRILHEQKGVEMTGDANLTVASGIDHAGENLKIAVKITNNSSLAVIGVTITLDAPAALEYVKGSNATQRIGSITPNSFQSAIFWLKATRCIDDSYGGVISYRDATNQHNTLQIPRKRLVNICPMLEITDSPKDIFAACKFGGLERNSTSFKFEGPPSVAFNLATSRVSSLEPVERIEDDFEGGEYLGYSCVVGRTKYEKQMFGAEIQVSGTPSGGVLTLSVYTDDERILSGFFVDIMTEVRQHVDILEENNSLKPTNCPNCNAPLNLANIPESRIYQCESCGSRGKIPPWMM